MAWSALETFTFGSDSNGAAIIPNSYAAPSTGQAWTDAKGGVWAINGGNLVGTTDTVDGSQFKRDFLTAGSNADAVNQRIVVGFTAGGSTPAPNFGAILRYQRTGNVGNSYLCNVNIAGQYPGFTLYGLQGSGNSASAIGSFSALTFTSGHSYTLDASVTGTSPSSIAIVITDTTANTTLFSQTYSDSTANLQNAGPVGLDVFSSAGNAAAQSNNFTSITTYSPFSVIVDDNFTRANTSVGSGANSTNVTGPGTYNSPSTGAPYTDALGNRWSISNNTLSAVTLTSGDYSDAFLLRPSSEACLNGKSALTFLPNANGNGGATLLVGRLQSSGVAYGCYVYSSTSGPSNWTFALVKIGSGANVQTVLTSAAPSLSGGTAYLMTLTLSGSSPTALTATIAAASSPSTIISTITASDSTSALQNSGQWGVSGNGYGGTAGTNPLGSTISRFTTYTADNPSNALIIGTLTLMTSASGLTLSLSSALSGGTGSGYGYKVYRGTDPNFTANQASLLATVAALPYTDTTAIPGAVYYYGVVGKDTATTVGAIPGGLGNYSPSYLAYVAGQLQTQDLNIVFIGDSITYGAGVSNSGSMNSPTMPYFCVTKLKRLLGIRTINASNQGHSGYTFTDWAPGGSAYNNAKSAMQSLISSDTTALPVFSVMLGTNDSAQAGTNNTGSSSPVTTTQITALMKNLINQLLLDFPGAKVFMHMAPYYTPSTHNGATYEQIGLSALNSYRAVLTSVVQSYASNKPGQVFVGDTYAFQYFAQNGRAGGEQQAESGSNGTFYLHPAGTAGNNGLIGTQSLGEMHAQAIAQGLYGTVVSAGNSAIHATGSRGGIR